MAVLYRRRGVIFHPELGAWQWMWEGHHRWSTDGTYAAMFAAVRAQGGSVEDAELARADLG